MLFDLRFVSGGRFVGHAGSPALIGRGSVRQRRGRCDGAIVCDCRHCMAGRGSPGRPVGRRSEADDSGLLQGRSDLQQAGPRPSRADQLQRRGRAALVRPAAGRLPGTEAWLTECGEPREGGPVRDRARPRSPHRSPRRSPCAARPSSGVASRSKSSEEPRPTAAGSMPATPAPPGTRRGRPRTSGARCGSRPRPRSGTGPRRTNPRCTAATSGRNDAAIMRAGPEPGHRHRLDHGTESLDAGPAPTRNRCGVAVQSGCRSTGTARRCAGRPGRSGRVPRSSPARGPTTGRGVVAGHHPYSRAASADRAGHRAHRVERRGQREHPVQRHPAVGDLEARRSRTAQPAPGPTRRCRYRSRAGPARRRRRPPNPRRSARRGGRIPGIADRPEPGVLAGEAEGELVEAGPADDRPPRRPRGGRRPWRIAPAPRGRTTSRRWWAARRDRSDP